MDCEELLPVDDSCIEVEAAEQMVSSESHTCNTCARQFTSKDTLKRHMKKHDSQNLMCRKCTLYFNSESSLALHNEKQHVNKHLCSVCGKTFTTKHSLQLHRAMHDPETHKASVFRCPLDNCQKTFVRKDRYEDHLNTHTGAKPYTCDYCKKQFHSRYVKADHVVFCSGARCPNCPECNQKFTDRSSMKRHIDAQHRQVSHRCTCGSVYQYVSSLNKHKKRTGH